MLAFIYFLLLCSIRIKFLFLKKFWMVDFLDFWCNICTKDGDHFFFLSLNSWLIFFIDFGQCLSLSTRLNFFFFRGFTFLTIMEHTANKIQGNNGLISSLLNMFAMFEIRLSYGEKELDVLYIKCINYKTERGLDSETSFTWVYDEIVTKVLLNAILHRVGMSWIIISNRGMYLW